MRIEKPKPGKSQDNSETPDEQKLAKRIEVIMDSGEDDSPPPADTETKTTALPPSAPEVSETEIADDTIALKKEDEKPAEDAEQSPTVEEDEPSQTTEEDEPSKVTEESPEPSTDEPLTTADEPDDVESPEPDSEQPETSEATEEDSNEPETSTEPTDESLPSNEEDEPVTDKAVDDIVAKEGDEVLAAEDAEIAAAFVPKKRGLKTKLKDFFAAWWHNPRARKATIATLILAILALVVIPPTRYFLLNTAGVRGSASLTVLDDSTGQPLKNVQVKLTGITAQTDNEGKVKLEHLKLGRSDLVIEKRAFAPLTRKITVGWGSNPLADFSLTPVGSQYVFVTTDFLSGKPVEKAEATSGEASAVSDKDGKIVLTIDKNDEDELKVSIKAQTYRDEELKINPNDKTDHRLKLAPARKQVFVSKRSGKLDVYKIDVDGKNEQLILAGTGSERDDMKLISHPIDEAVAVISTRENSRNREGFLLSTLTLIDLGGDKTVTKVGQSERIQVVDWLGDRLVYVQIAAGTSAGNPKRQRLMSYDYKTEESKELAAANYFNDVLIAAGQVYYSPPSYLASEPVGLHRVNADGTNKQKVYAEEVWNIFRVGYDQLSLSVQGQWYDYKLGSSKPEKAAGAPANLKTRVYIDSPDKQRSLWVEERDGKGVLLAYSLTDKNDKVLRAQSGLKYPVRWLNDRTLVYRINTDQETADYAMSLNGGEPVKVRDVTHTGAVEQWYY